MDRGANQIALDLEDEVQRSTVCAPRILDKVGASTGMVFYLGTHRASWLPRTDVPLFISAVQLRGRRTFPKAKGRWALDSGGFSELFLHGRWTVDARAYAADVRRWADAVGKPDFVAIQDWMCEPVMLARTGLSIAEHQRRTTRSYLELMSIAPDLPWMPVLQGWHKYDYLSHLGEYASLGVDLTKLPIVGVGTICKRQASSQAARIIASLWLQSLKIHAFGVKADGIRHFGQYIASADSMAWSFVARRRPVLLDGCEGHKNCANCIRWAMEWHRTRITEAA